MGNVKHYITEFKAFLNRKAIVDFVFERPIHAAYLSSAMVFLILFFFEPFNLNEHVFSIKTQLALIFSLFTFVLYILYISIAYYIIHQPKLIKALKNFHEIVFVLLLIPLTGVLIYMLTAFVVACYESKMYFPNNFWIEAIRISGIMVTANYGMLKVANYLFYLQRQLRERRFEGFNQQPISLSGGGLEPSADIRIYGRNKTDGVYIYKVNAILYIESHDKELIITYKAQGGQVKKMIFKQSLKELEEQFNKLEANPFYRCHKSFIINKNYINELTGNSRSASVSMKHGIIIPISRTKMNDLKRTISF